MEKDTLDAIRLLRAVLFDCDGTLLDSYAAIAASVNHVRSLHGLAPLSLAEVKRYVGRGANYLLSHTVPVGSVAANLEAYKAHHPSVLRSGTTLLPGAAEMLRALHERGLRLAVCSNKAVEFTRELMAMFGVDSVLDAVLGPEDVQRPKPAPDMLLTALQRLGVPATDALYVGDMVVDVETARAARVRVWAVPTGSDAAAALVEAKPDRIVSNLVQFREILERALQRPV
jgi:phosphoglycolate phosphatase